MSSIFFGKAFCQRAMLALIAASLSGCFDDGSAGAGSGGLAEGPVAEQPSPQPSNEPPEVSGTPAATAVAGQTYSFQPVASDADEDFLEYTITNQPGWASFNDESGLLTGVPSDTHVGESEDITITVTDGKDTRSIGPFKIRVHPRGQPPSSSTNQAPVISGTPPASVLAGTYYEFQPTASDADGDVLRFSISNRPSWARFSTTTGRLSGTPTTGNVATYSNIVISVNDGTDITLLPAFSIQVQGPNNNPPTISGTPGTSVLATQTYTFVPSATDPDGDTLVYSIVNRPRWANFSTASGRLSGTPAATDVGNYSDIRISVSDGRATVSLPGFAISVSAPANRAPSITGTPAASVSAGAMYSFTPSATDPDGDELGFTIQNAPSWATFNTSTGSLSGTPGSTHVGTFSNIVISVSDGVATVSLPAFSIAVSQSTTPTPTPTPTGSATLSWTPPTTNTDGSALNDLAGYRVVYGRSSTTLDQLVQISSASARTYTVTGLSTGTWYFALKSYNTAGVESDMSNIGTKVIP